MTELNEIKSLSATMVAPTVVSLNHFDYTAFFHYKMGCHERVVEWVKSVSLEAVMACEHEDHQNITDRHLQVWMRLDREWDTALGNALGVNGSVGKFLVKNKTANDGVKSAKRWSKRRSTISKVESIQYVLKDGGPFYTHNVEITDEMRLPPVKVIELRSKGKTERPPAKPFYKQLIELWEQEGKPKEHHAIYEMLVDHQVLNKWNYCDAKSIFRMATFLQLRSSPNGKRALMDAYEKLKWDL